MSTKHYTNRIVSRGLRLVACMGLALTAAFHSNAQTVFLNEDFASASGSTPPSGWSNNTVAGDPGFDKWRFDNPAGRTLNSPISAPAGIFDSDNYSTGGGAEEATLESSAVSTIGHQKVLLKWDQYFQSGFGGTANVEIFDGTTWQSVYFNNSTTTSNPNTQQINVSAHAANRAGVQVRFRWNGDWSWYWIVDNVQLIDPVVTPTFDNGTDQTIAVCEDAATLSLNSQLGITDATPVGFGTDTIDVQSGPSHGTLSGFPFIQAVNGGSITPTGLGYTPAAGYSGADTFVVFVTNGTYTTTATVAVTVNPLPDAITGTLQACEGGVMVTLGNTSGPGTWSSDNAAAATINATTGEVTTVSDGNADIHYTITATGCARTVEFTVNPIPAAITGADEVCVMATTALTNSDAGGTWSSSVTAAATIGTDGVVTGAGPGVTTITYTLPTTCAITHDITVNALPAIFNVTGGGSYCFGAAGVHIGTDNTETGVVYTLMNGASTITTVTGTTGAADFGLITGAGTYTVMATNPATCVSNMAGSATVTIIPLVTPAVTLSTAPGDTVCDGTSITFTASPVNEGATPTYTWEVNSMVVSTGTSATHSYTPADGDVVTVTLTSSETCPSPATATDSKTLVVVDNETPVATIFVGPNDTLCQGTTAVYAATSLFGGDAPVYTWYINGIATGITGDTYSYEPHDNDIVSAKLNSNYRCPVVNNVSSNNITMQVDTVFIPAVTITTNTGLTISAGDTVTFTASVASAGMSPSYQWIKNNMPLAGEVSATYTTSAIANGDSVTCVVYGTGLCSYWSFNSVRMMVTTGIESVSAGTASVKVIPNPNNGAFIISGSFTNTHTNNVDIEIVNMLGQSVHHQSATLNDGNINEPIALDGNLPAGMYMAHMTNGSQTATVRVMIAR